MGLWGFRGLGLGVGSIWGLVWDLQGSGFSLGCSWSLGGFIGFGLRSTWGLGLSPGSISLSISTSICIYI